MDPLQKYHEVLGLKEGANLSEIKQAFRELAFQFHPDRNPHNPHAEEKFKQIAQAYAILSGNEEMFSALERPQSGTHEAKRFVHDIFGDIFSVDVKKLPPKILSEWEVPCETCRGSGSAPGMLPHLCTYCFGQGTISVEIFQHKIQKQCPQCLGRGKISPQVCKVCQGRGVLKRGTRGTFTFDGARNLCEILLGFLKKLKHFFLGS